MWKWIQRKGIWGAWLSKQISQTNINFSNHYFYSVLWQYTVLLKTLFIAILALISFVCTPLMWPLPLNIICENITNSCLSPPPPPPPQPYCVWFIFMEALLTKLPNERRDANLGFLGNEKKMKEETQTWVFLGMKRITWTCRTMRGGVAPC